MTTYLYPRISSKSQTEASQLPDLKRWAAAQDQSELILTERDTFTGTTMSRPGWDRIWAAVCDGRCNRVVVWRLDRLGRTARELTALFEEMIRRNVTLVSLREGFDLSTPGGRLFANLLASVAQYETEVRSERQLAGIEAAKARGVKFGRKPGEGGRPGKPIKVTPEQAKLIRDMNAAHTAKAAIARATGLSRGTVYSVLGGAGGLFLIYSGVKGQADPVYAVRARNQDEAARFAFRQHPEPGSARLAVKPDDGTAARLKLVVLASQAQA